MSIAPAVVEIFWYRGTLLKDVTRFEDIDYSAATFDLQVRNYPDEATPLLTLGNAASNAQGVSCSTVTETIDGIEHTHSDVQIRLNETTGEAIRKSAPVGGDIELVFALDITGGGHEKTRRMRGKLILKAGEAL
ncbi:hypothetical protein [Stakelama pacifica]|uniref:Uncharacterized protein n=1 Tax=Stakelama pacifica TaxID=517720 RepID=A0A4R6FMD6_9SPHN|nr:hypothetical protein [Stakelama pacifica]TDN81795.1 hypothetical protein EV664_107197 [Stakelama pacifica]GGO96591.1 hypothetical protein GCM10011329_23480 [Stakelama pacifica]